MQEVARSSQPRGKSARRRPRGLPRSSSNQLEHQSLGGERRPSVIRADFVRQPPAQDLRPAIPEAGDLAEQPRGWGHALEPCRVRFENDLTGPGLCEDFGVRLECRLREHCSAWALMIQSRDSLREAAVKDHGQTPTPVTVRGKPQPRGKGCVHDSESLDLNRPEIDRPVRRGDRVPPARCPHVLPTNRWISGGEACSHTMRSFPGASRPQSAHRLFEPDSVHAGMLRLIRPPEELRHEHRSTLRHCYSRRGSNRL